MQTAMLPHPAERLDPLTGLCARWYLEARTEDALSHALRTDGKVFLVTLTAHTRGAAERLEEWLRSGLQPNELATDAGFRRYAVLVTDSDVDGVWSIAKRAQSSVLTPVDVGVATFPDDGMTFQQLLASGGAIGVAA